MEKTHRGRKVLAARLNALMDGHIELYNQKRLAARSGIGQTTIGRILHCQVSCTVDVIQELADSFGRDMGELLREGPERGGIDYERDRYARLPAYEKARVEAFIKSCIAEHEYKESQAELGTATRVAAQTQADIEPRRIRRTGPRPTLEKAAPSRPAAKKRAAR